MDNLMTKARSLFQSRYRNRQFRSHIDQVQDILNKGPSTSIVNPSEYRFLPCTVCRLSIPPVFALTQLFERNAPDWRPSTSTLEVPGVSQDPRPRTNTSELSSLLLGFQHNRTNTFYRLYGNALDRSRESLAKTVKSVTLFNHTPHLMKSLVQYGNTCKGRLQASLELLRRSLYPLDLAEDIMRIAGLWPRITPFSLLQSLALGSNEVLNHRWRKSLIRLGQAFLDFQRSQRLIRLAHLKHDDEFIKELENEMCNDLEAIRWPDWLLIQVMVVLSLISWK
jgi:hypothetical protein